MNESEKGWLTALVGWHSDQAMKLAVNADRGPGSRNFHQTAARLIDLAIDELDEAGSASGVSRP